MAAAVLPPSSRSAIGRGLRISEIATLRLDQCQVNQRAGSITLIDAKGGKTRTLDLHNMARRALYDYLFPEHPRDRERDQESIYVFSSRLCCKNQREMKMSTRRSSGLA
ncbi:tyrosine-type recombinase/integrase [Ktedonobacter racemifer]|uniref:tyrosine-type recombinase/integrase n=1 Tax=Ktedonobacter racemifer TaxID=363277 RepID=UPI0012F87D61